MQELKCGWGCVAGAAQERKAQHKSMEATYVKPSACFGTAVLRTKNIVPGKIIPETPTVSLFWQIYLISCSAYEAITSVSWSSTVIYCHKHGLKEMKSKWEHSDRFDDH